METQQLLDILGANAKRLDATLPANDPAKGLLDRCIKVLTTYALPWNQVLDLEKFSARGTEMKDEDRNEDEGVKKLSWSRAAQIRHGMQRYEDETLRGLLDESKIVVAATGSRDRDERAGRARSEGVVATLAAQMLVNTPAAPQALRDRLGSELVKVTASVVDARSRMPVWRAFLDETRTLIDRERIAAAARGDGKSGGDVARFFAPSVFGLAKALEVMERRIDVYNHVTAEALTVVGSLFFRNDVDVRPEDKRADGVDIARVRRLVRIVVEGYTTESNQMITEEITKPFDAIMAIVDGVQDDAFKVVGKVRNATLVDQKQYELLATLELVWGKHGSAEALAEAMKGYDVLVGGERLSEAKLVEITERVYNTIGGPMRGGDAIEDAKRQELINDTWRELNTYDPNFRPADRFALLWRAAANARVLIKPLDEKNNLYDPSDVLRKVEEDAREEQKRIFAYARQGVAEALLSKTASFRVKCETILNEFITVQDQLSKDVNALALALEKSADQDVKGALGKVLFIRNLGGSPTLFASVAQLVRTILSVYDEDHKNIKPADLNKLTAETTKWLQSTTEAVSTKAALGDLVKMNSDIWDAYSDSIADTYAFVNDAQQAMQTAVIQLQRTGTGRADELKVRDATAELGRQLARANTAMRDLLMPATKAAKRAAEKTPLRDLAVFDYETWSGYVDRVVEWSRAVSSTMDARIRELRATTKTSLLANASERIAKAYETKVAAYTDALVAVQRDKSNLVYSLSFNRLLVNLLNRVLAMPELDMSQLREGAREYATRFAKSGSAAARFYDTLGTSYDAMALALALSYAARIATGKEPDAEDADKLALGNQVAEAVLDKLGAKTLTDIATYTAVAKEEEKLDDGDARADVAAGKLLDLLDAWDGFRVLLVRAQLYNLHGHVRGSAFKPTSAKLSATIEAIRDERPDDAKTNRVKLDELEVDASKAVTEPGREADKILKELVDAFSSLVGRAGDTWQAGVPACYENGNARKDSVFDTRQALRRLVYTVVYDKDAVVPLGKGLTDVSMDDVMTTEPETDEYRMRAALDDASPNLPMAVRRAISNKVREVIGSILARAPVAVDSKGEFLDVVRRPEDALDRLLADLQVTTVATTSIQSEARKAALELVSTTSRMCRLRINNLRTQLDVYHRNRPGAVDDGTQPLARYIRTADRDLDELARQTIRVSGDSADLQKVIDATYVLQDDLERRVLLVNTSTLSAASRVLKVPLVRANDAVNELMALIAKDKVAKLPSDPSAFLGGSLSGKRSLATLIRVVAATLGDARAGRQLNSNVFTIVNGYVTLDRAIRPRGVPISKDDAEKILKRKEVISEEEAAEYTAYKEFEAFAAVDSVLNSPALEDDPTKISAKDRGEALRKAIELIFSPVLSGQVIACLVLLSTVYDTLLDPERQMSREEVCLYGKPTVTRAKASREPDLILDRLFRADRSIVFFGQYIGYRMLVHADEVTVSPQEKTSYQLTRRADAALLTELKSSLRASQTNLVRWYLDAASWK